MPRPDRWTPEEEAWLREVYPTHHNATLSEMHAERFPDCPRRGPKAISSRAKVLKLRKADDFVRNPPRMWPPEKVEWFRNFVPGHTEPEISAEHERVFGTPLSEGQIGNAKTKLGVRSGTCGGRFQKGCAGGFKSEEHRRKFIEAGKATRFKKGQLSGIAAQHEQPVGSERVNKDGYVEVKVADGLQSSPNSNFRMKHHLVYEQAYGSIPRGCNVVFANHDKRDFSPENLVAVPRPLWSVISRQGWAYNDRESLEACMALARLSRKVYEARLHPRNCKSCGGEFEPRYPHQRTCDACLGR